MAGHSVFFLQTLREQDAVSFPGATPGLHGALTSRSHHDATRTPRAPGSPAIGPSSTCVRTPDGAAWPPRQSITGHPEFEPRTHYLDPNRATRRGHPGECNGPPYLHPCRTGVGVEAKTSTEAEDGAAEHPGHEQRGPRWRIHSTRNLWRLVVLTVPRRLPHEIHALAKLPEHQYEPKWRW
jgi:hypothetical protein